MDMHAVVASRNHRTKLEPADPFDPNCPEALRVTAAMARWKAGTDVALEPKGKPRVKRTAGAETPIEALGGLF